MTGRPDLVSIDTIAQAFNASVITVKQWRRRRKYGEWPDPLYVGKEHKAHFEFAPLPEAVQGQLVRTGLHCVVKPTVAAADAAEPPATESGPSTYSEAEAETLARVYEAKPGKQKERARRSLEIVQRYHALRASGADSGFALSSTSSEFSVCQDTVRRCLDRVDGKPEHLWLYLLAPGYAGRTSEAEISAEAWEALKADYLRLERPTAVACIDRLKLAAAAHGWSIPSDRTLERRLEKLPRAVKVAARHGQKALEQLYPHQTRDKQALCALQIINGDGYKHNLWVTFPDGEILRAKTWFWQDVYSSRILAWRTDKTEHTDVIRLSFGDVVERYGIPQHVLLDNTLAAANKTMSGGVKHRFRFKVRDEEPLGVFPLVIGGTRPIMWAKPDHGQSKPIERTFGIGGIGEYVDKAPEFSGSWSGANTLDKPEYDGRTKPVPLAALERAIEREVAAFNARTGRRGAIQRGRSFDEVFQESYTASPIRRATEAQRLLWLLATEPVRAASRDGAITLEAGRAPGMANRYWAPQLNDYAGRMVAARFDPKRLHEGVHVYAIDGRYICFAQCYEAKGFADQDAGREHNRARQQYRKGVNLQVKAERRMSAIQAGQIYAGVDQPTIPPARGVVVRGEFRDPLARPAAPNPEAMSDADLEALKDEIARTEQRTVVQLEDDQMRFQRWTRLKERMAAGHSVTDDDAQWIAGYESSAEFRSMKSFYEDPAFRAFDRSRPAG